MTKFIFYCILLIALFIVQISVLPYFYFYGSSANVLFVAAVFFAFYMFDFRDLMIFSFVSAMLVDFYSGYPFGVLLVSFLVAIATTHFMARNIFGKANFAIATFGTAIASVVYFVLSMSGLKIIDIWDVESDVLLHVDKSFIVAALITIVLNLLLAVILHFPLKKYLYSLEKK